LLYKWVGACDAWWDGVEGKGGSVQIPRKLITDLLEASLRFHEVVETLEVQLDKETLRRLKIGEKEYKRGGYRVASTRQEIDKVLSG